MAANISVVVYPNFKRQGHTRDRQSSHIDQLDLHWDVEDLISLLFRPTIASTIAKSA